METLIISRAQNKVVLYDYDYSYIIKDAIGYESQVKKHNQGWWEGRKAGTTVNAPSSLDPVRPSRQLSDRRTEGPLSPRELEPTTY